MKFSGEKESRKAFTRLELCVVLGLLALMAAVALPALASTNNRSLRAGCVNNLRQIGQAFAAWAAEHGGDNPSMVNAHEGLRGHSSGMQGNVFMQLSWVSNQLSSPRVFVCPSDINRPTADNWGAGTGGLLNTAYRNRASSYFVNAHTVSGIPGLLLSGDYNLPADMNTSCSIGATMSRFSYGVATFQWTNNLHGRSGNLLFDGGNVEQVSNDKLRQVVGNASTGAGLHVAAPSSL